MNDDGSSVAVQQSHILHPPCRCRRDKNLQSRGAVGRYRDVGQVARMRPAFVEDAMTLSSREVAAGGFKIRFGVAQTFFVDMKGVRAGREVMRLQRKQDLSGGGFP